MADTVNSLTRSRMMSTVKGKDTTPELLVRRYLHKAGFRFRLHRKDLPGKPDLVLTKFRLVIFVHGCFWHQHLGCKYGTLPSTNSKFWLKKLEGNSKRDQRQVGELLSKGWRVLIIWECGIKHCFDNIIEILSFIIGDDELMSWPKTPPRTK